MIIYIYINIIIYNIVCVFVLDDDLHRSSSFLRDSAHVMTPPITPQLPPARSDRSKPERCRDGEMGRVWWFQGTNRVALAPENDRETVINIMKSNGLSWSVYRHVP